METNQQRIKFSVIIPVYNTESYLKQCLDSVFASSEDLEVIAIDDGSTDNSAQLLDSIQDPRLKVIHKENEGVFKSWQYGVRQSTGDYIVFVDSDDYIDPSLFSDLSEILKEKRYDLVQYNWKRVLGDQLVSEKYSVFLEQRGGV